jgi:hypothetical protein
MSHESENNKPKRMIKAKDKPKRLIFSRLSGANFPTKIDIKTMLLRHKHQGKDLKIDWAVETLKNIHKIWSRPVNIATIIESENKVIHYDGAEPRIEKGVNLD